LDVVTYFFELQEVGDMLLPTNTYQHVRKWA